MSLKEGRPDLEQADVRGEAMEVQVRVRDHELPSGLGAQTHKLRAGRELRQLRPQGLQPRELGPPAALASFLRRA